MDYITVKPAYGKQLNSKKSVEDHFHTNKDFQILSVVHGAGRYINKRDLHKFAPQAILEVRYGKNLDKIHFVS